MFRRILGVLILVSCIVSPEVAAAQERAPHAGSTAVGVDVGAFMPTENQLDNALIVSVLLDIRHAARQPAHGLRIDRSRLLA